jgi:hypothetical protein
MLKNRTQPLSIYKIRAHTNIQGNEKVDQLAKVGNGLSYSAPRQDFEHAHSTPYYLHRDWWNTIAQPSYKGPIRHLHKYIHESDRAQTLEELAHSLPTIQKWTNDPNIDKDISTSFWNQSNVTNSQITCLLKV